jgi:hypothetical protein
MSLPPVMWEYTHYEQKVQHAKPMDDASHKTAKTRDDPNFNWHSSGREHRGMTVWVRATKRRLSPAYKEYLLKRKHDIESALSGLSGMRIGNGSAQNLFNKEGFVKYSKSLTTGKSGNILKREAEHAMHAEKAAEELSSIMALLGMEGGKKTRKARKSRRRHTSRK